MAEDREAPPSEGSEPRRKSGTKTKTKTAGGTARRRSRKPKSPPNRVDPGWLHEAIAKLILALAQSRVQGAAVPVDLGNVKTDEVISAITPEDDGGKEPVDLLARVVAHIFHRIPGVRQVEKRLEGKDQSSGLASDLLAFVVQLIRRNEPVIEVYATAAMEGARQQRAQKRATAAAEAPTGVPPNQGG